VVARLATAVRRTATAVRQVITAVRVVNLAGAPAILCHRQSNRLGHPPPHPGCLTMGNVVVTVVLLVWVHNTVTAAGTHLRFQ
jgi:hypothetical protein